MINNDKVKLMMKIQLFEDQEAEVLRAGRFYQHDYLGLHLIRSFFAYTLLYILVMGMVFLYNWEELLTKVKLSALLEGGKVLLISFIVLLIPVMIVSYIVYWFRYRGYRKKIKAHIANLKQLNVCYEDPKRSDREEEEKQLNKITERQDLL